MVLLPMAHIFHGKKKKGEKSLIPISNYLVTDNHYLKQIYHCNHSQKTNVTHEKNHRKLKKALLF